MTTVFRFCQSNHWQMISFWSTNMHFFFINELSIFFLVTIAIYIYSWVKCLFNSFAHFFISLITFFLLIHKSSLPILLMNPSLEHKLKYYGIIHFSLRGVSLNRFFFNFSILKSIKLFLYVLYFLRHVLKFLPYSRQ